MQRFLISSVLGLLLVAALAPTPARAAETIHFAQDARFASAQFSSTDPSGCVLTAVVVLATDDRRREGPGAGEQQSEAIATIERHDLCVGTPLLAAEGRATLASEAFQIDDLESATLNAAIEVFDSVANASFVVDIDLAWEGVGDARRLRTHTHIKTRAFTTNFRLDGTFRSAAASGTVTDGRTNFTPEPGVDDSLWTIRAGRITVQRN